MHKRAPGPPWITLLLILANVVVFAVELSQGSELPVFAQRWGLVPADVSAWLRQQPGADAGPDVTLLTSMFLHADWLHLLLNMLYLAVFGATVERRLGRLRYTVLYLVAGVVGGLAHVLSGPTSDVPAIGASGAIAGVIGANLVLLPGASVGSLAPVLFPQPVRNVPAFVLLAIWAIAQFFTGLATIAAASRMAWWAHVGGFLGGVVLALLLRTRERRWW